MNIFFFRLNVSLVQIQLKSKQTSKLLVNSIWNRTPQRYHLNNNTRMDRPPHNMPFSLKHIKKNKQTKKLNITINF